MVQEKIYSYFERNPQLHVLFIFDKMNINFTELELAEWPDNYIYKVFDGAWFNVKYAIENTWKDKKIVLLFTDGTYPHTEEQMLKFPLLDMLKANIDSLEFSDKDNWQDKFYGIPGDKVEKYYDESRGSTLTVNYYESEDGVTRTAFGSVSGQVHECRQHSIETAWKFISQFTR